MMNLRKDEVVSAELEIYSSLDHFDAPPCQPPKGKDVLNRLYRILNHQPKNSKNVSSAASQVTTELINLWKFGDSRIPLMDKKH